VGAIRTNGPSPVFSVVVPAYNAQSTVASAVRSVLAQTRCDAEVIVVDDGSTDGTYAQLERLAGRRVRIARRPHGGIAAARNAGISLARGRYIAFLDSDDLLLPRYLELAGEVLERADRLGFAYTDAYAFDPVAGLVGPRRMEGGTPPTPPPDDCERFQLELLRRNFVYVSAIVPRSVLEALGGFDESLGAAEDYELWLRIVRAGYMPVWIPGRHALYRVHDRQLSNDRLALREAERSILQALLAESVPSDAHRRALRRHLRNVERDLRILRGEARVAASVRCARGALGSLLGLDRRRWGPPPADVAGSYPDLTLL
jgi:glycosyltransferase involved in cell wall biosynthesis